MTWGTYEEQQRRLRIRVAVAAFAYEIADNPILSDAEYDALARQIDPSVMTGHPIFDEFFVAQFEPTSGAWVRLHPDQPGLRRVYERLVRRANKVEA